MLSKTLDNNKNINDWKVKRIIYEIELDQQDLLPDDFDNYTNRAIRTGILTNGWVSHLTEYIFRENKNGTPNMVS